MQTSNVFRYCAIINAPLKVINYYVALHDDELHWPSTVTRQTCHFSLVS